MTDGLLPARLEYGSETERAWAAGFFDGEGTTCVINGWHLSLSIGQVGREVLDRFNAATGNLCSIYGPYDVPNPRDSSLKCQPQHQLATRSGAKVQQVVALMWDYLGTVKREQAAAAIGTWKAYHVAHPHLAKDPRTGRAYVCRRGHKLTDDNMLRGQCRKCVNLSHVEAYWRKPGNLGRRPDPDAPKPQRTHCANGHPWGNIYVRPDGAKACRPCLREANARLRAKRKAAP